MRSAIALFLFVETTAGWAATVIHAEDVPALTIGTLLKANSYELTLTDDGLAGPGGDLLVEAASGAQFVCLGEPHNSNEVPPFASTLFEIMHSKHGFDHLALEQDPFACELASAPAVV